MTLPSQALTKLQAALKDVDELVLAHEVVTGGGRGKPAARQGAAISRAGTVLVYAALEAFVEDLFEEAADIVFAGWTADQRTEFLKSTVKRFNNADVFKTNYLFFNLGIPWIFEGISWKKFKNSEVQRSVNDLVQKRNQVAHGSKPEIRLASVRRWRNMLAQLGPRFESMVTSELRRIYNKASGW